MPPELLVPMNRGTERKFNFYTLILAHPDSLDGIHSDPLEPSQSLLPSRFTRASHIWLMEQSIRCWLQSVVIETLENKQKIYYHFPLRTHRSQDGHFRFNVARDETASKRASSVSGGPVKVSPAPSRMRQMYTYLQRKGYPIQSFQFARNCSVCLQVKLKEGVRPSVQAVTPRRRMCLSYWLCIYIHCEGKHTCGIVGLPQSVPEIRLKW